MRRLWASLRTGAPPEVGASLIKATVDRLGIDAASAHIVVMAARDNWSVSLKCPKCGKAGEAEFSEDDYPFMRKSDFRVETISQGFQVRKYGGTSSATEIICSDCGELAK